MQSSKSRHNFFSKADHDKNYIETNYVKPKKSKGVEKAPVVDYNVRKMLAVSDLQVKMSTKSPVITASSLQKYDDPPLPFEDQDDGASSVTSNHSEALVAYKEALSRKISHKLNISLNPDQLENDQGLVVGDDDDDVDNAYDQPQSLVSGEGQYGQYVEHDNLSDDEDEEGVGEMKAASAAAAPKFNSTLEVHRSFMREKSQTDTMRSIQLVESLKILAPPQDIDLAEFGSRKHVVVDSPQKPLKDSSSVGSSPDKSAAAKSFMFLSKLASAREAPVPVAESARAGIKGKSVKKPQMPIINQAVVNLVSELITGDDMSVASSTNEVDYQLPLYEATPLKHVHETKQRPILKLMDQAFAALTFQRKEPVAAPVAKGIPVLKMKTLFDQNELVSAHLTRGEAADDEQFYRALREHVDKKKKKQKEAEAAAAAAPSAGDVVSGISAYLEKTKDKPKVPLKSALKSSSKWADVDAEQRSPDNIYRPKTAPLTPLLDLSKAKNFLSPVTSGTVSPQTQPDHPKLPLIASPAAVGARKVSVLADRKQLFPSVSPMGSPLASPLASPALSRTGGPYSKALSPEAQRYVGEIRAERDPHLRSSGIADTGGEDEEDEDDDLRDLKRVHAEQKDEASPGDRHRYQHSTTSFVRQGEINNSRFGLHARHPPYPDGWSGNGEGTIQFSERHLQAIEDSTVGSTPAVIYIPNTNKHSTDHSVHSTRPPEERTALLHANGSMYSLAPVDLHPGTTVLHDNYAGITKQLNYTNSERQLTSLPQVKSFSSGTSAGAPSVKKSARFATPDKQANLKVEINDYIDRIHSPSITDDGTDDDATARSQLSTQEARDALWYKLHNRYAGDREGLHVTKKKVDTYVLGGIKEDNYIMNDYDEEMEDGWDV